MRFSALNWRQYFSVLALGLTLALSVADHADARRAGGSLGGFGSRGTRTYQAPPTTAVAPTPAAPIQRSMTQPSQPGPASSVQPQPAAPRPGLFGGFGGSLLGGLLVGGLLGAVFGGGFGGAFGFLGMLFQIALLAGAAMLVIRFIRRRQGLASPVAGAAGRGMPSDMAGYAAPQAPGSSAGTPSSPPRQADEIGMTQPDLDTFERLLGEVQTAYGREDYATLRTRTTPEAMSYLAEELGENATRGVRNIVSDVHLLQGNVAEAWREGDTDYATLAMRYASIDATVDRATGKVVEGDAKNTTEATEVWTFARKGGAEWKLSAIQAA